MAKQQKKITFDTTTADEAENALRDLRSGRGGASSVYEPVGEAAQKLKKGEAITMTVDKKDVGALRAYLYRLIGKDKLDVKSARKEKGKDDYLVVIRHAEPK